MPQCTRAECGAQHPTREWYGATGMRIGCGRASECRRMGEVLGAAVGAEPRRVRSHRRASGVRCPATSARAVCVAWAIVPRCARAGCDTQPSAREREGAAGARAGCCGWVPVGPGAGPGSGARPRHGSRCVSQCARAACCSLPSEQGRDATADAGVDAEVTISARAGCCASSSTRYRGGLRGPGAQAPAHGRDALRNH